jgi:hypothetical protein
LNNRSAWIADYRAQANRTNGVDDGMDHEFIRTAGCWENPASPQYPDIPFMTNLESLNASLGPTSQA